MWVIHLISAVLAANLGLTPNNDGKLIRLNVPSLSGDQRKKLAARIKDLAEDARVSIRNVRRDANKAIDAEEKGKTMTEDERDQAKEEVQELTKTYETKVNDMADKKSAEIME